VAQEANNWKRGFYPPIASRFIQGQHTITADLIANFFKTKLPGSGDD
jgi:hypothetical protein